MEARSDTDGTIVRGTWVVGVCVCVLCACVSCLCLVVRVCGFWLSVFVCVLRVCHCVVVCACSFVFLCLVCVQDNKCWTMLDFLILVNVFFMSNFALGIRFF